ncbi:16S rRNA (uracil(1498)-N(3))-methyltransferase [Candidatus Uhrbacteria bacterium]|nr:16S rRNA (uracil(1498)-N(3))-methyltransferase [Candidatus Uhrbacteria bacterium]
MSSLPSFFLSPTAFHDRAVTIRQPEIIRQMRKVFRMQSGSAFIALDGAGHEYACVIDHIDHTLVRALVEKQIPNTREPAIPVVLYPSLIRRERFATILEKCTELGVALFSPIAATRSPYRDIAPHLRGRWETIIRESAEVARRGLLPQLSAVTTLATALAAIPQGEHVIALSTAQEGIKTAKDTVMMIRGMKRIHLFLGPEGDYTEEEYTLLKERGAIPFSLGARIVRSETAAIAAVALFTALQ